MTFDPQSLSTLKTEMENSFERSRNVHLHLGYVAGIGAALDIIREHLISTHPVRKRVFSLLMEVSEETVDQFIKDKAKIREGMLAEHNRKRSQI